MLGSAPLRWGNPWEPIPLQNPSREGNPPSISPAGALPVLRQALRRRFAVQPEASSSSISDPGDPATLLQAVRRHRLALALIASPEALPWPPETLAALRQEAHQQQRAALPLIVDTLKVVAALEEAGLRALLLKGPALALQTTGQPWRRGGGDIDVLVAPADLPEAVALLEALGYERPAGQFPRQLCSFWGRYSRWASHELPMKRGGRWLDLHWALNTVRAPLPPFDLLWHGRQTLALNRQSVPTLGLEHAFRHACLHAASDQWMELRQLVDLALLARQLPPEAGRRLRRFKTVRFSCAAAFDATGCEELLAFTDLSRAECRRAIARARWTQERPPRLTAEGAWHPGHWLATVRRRASLSSSPIDWLRVVARFSLLPAAFNDPVTSQDRGLVGMLRARRRRLQEKLREHP
ncbi:MAG: nucleotidyltransferase family protein [Cyanobium sp.]